MVESRWCWGGVTVVGVRQGRLIGVCRDGFWSLGVRWKGHVWCSILDNAATAPLRSDLPSCSMFTITFLMVVVVFAANKHSPFVAS